MNIIVDLPFQQYVKVKYNVATTIGAAVYLVMRVMVDGQENTEMRAHFNGLYPSLFRYGEVFLSKGKH